MNISGLLRSMLGDMQPADAKTLELKVGQIVKGIVLQLLSEQDALVNINGVQVRARLETPLKQGESTLLQVQPQSANGQPVLKPLQGSAVQIAESSFPELLKELGQKDTSAVRQLVLTMQREGVPITKETVAAFADAMKEKPAKVGADEWTQTAVLAFKRGLPLTGETLAALRQAVNGPPLYELVQRLGAEAEAQLREAGLPPALRQPLQQLAETVRQALGEAAAALSGGGDEAAPAQRTLPGTAPPARAGAEPPAAAAGLRAPAAAPGPAPAQQAPADGAARTAAAPGTAAAAAPSPPPVRAAQPQAPAAHPVQPGAAAPAPPAGEAAGMRASAASPAAAQREPADHWIGRVLKALGAMHERELLRLGAKPEPLLDSAPGASGAAAEATADAPQLPGSATLKSLLLQLIRSEDVPAGFKDTVQQTLQQITGQQLLLSPDRNAPFAQVTLFVPFQDGNGQQTSSVHIQSRRGSRGQLDADNCRLLFDLYMKQMGNTLLDVQVVDRTVSLNVRNDHPAVPALIEAYRDEIMKALHGAGYELLSLHFGPYPTPADYKDNVTDSTEAQSAFDSSRSQLKSLMLTKPYKGVDFRV